MKRRILSLVLVLSLLIGSAVRPQRAGAVVATTAAVAASAAAILTACGVSYWAATQTDAIDYIAGKIDDYLVSIDETGTSYEDWLEISSTSQLFEVVSGGVMRFSSDVANKLLDFCRWLQDDEGIDSGGSAVVSGGIQVLESSRLVDGADCQVDLENGVLSVTITGAKSNNSNFDAGYYIFIPVFDVDNPVYYTLSYTSLPFSVYGSWTDDVSMSGGGSNLSKGTYQANTYNSETYYKLYVWTLSTSPQSGTFDFSLSGATLKNGDAIITPSDFVNIPSDIASDATFSVNPSVSLAEGDSVDTAAEAILDGITSENGLSSTVEESPSTAWGWLYTLLVNIAEAITNGVADIKQAVLGLADSIYSKFTTVLQDIKNGISTIVNSITSAVSQLLSAIQALPNTIYNQFTQVLQDIKTGIQGIALDIYTDVINALTYVFVPSQAFIDTYVASLYTTFDNHFSILSYPFSILGEFITRASGIGSPEPMFTWGNIYEPFSGKLLIAAGSYNLNSMLSNQTFAQVYSIYMIVIKGLISFAFLKFLYNWFCDVFKMREDDFSSPFDVEEEEDGEDFDGYDGYYTS